MAFEIDVQLSEDRQLVSITMVLDQRPLAYTTMGPGALDRFIEMLGAQRQKMVPPVPDRLQGTDSTLVVLDPKWQASEEELPQGRAIALRHPCFGWLGFMFSREKARALADWLVQELPKGGQFHRSIN